VAISTPRSAATARASTSFAVARQVSSSFCLAGIASVLAERELDDDAATLWGTVCAAEESLGFRMLPAERHRYESRLARLENTGAWIAGKALTLEDAAALIWSS
jgi:hypothetical protein